jgi:hypothetical protein
MGTGTILAVASCVFFALLSLGLAGVAVYAARQARVQNLPDVVSLRGVALEAREALDDRAEVLNRRGKRVEMQNRRAAQREEQQEESDPMEAALLRARAQGLPV